MSELTQVLITALTGAVLTAVVLAAMLAQQMAALWRTRRQRDAAHEAARYHADRAEQLLGELDDITERTRPLAAALLGLDAPLTGWAARTAEQIAALPETPATWPVIPGPDGPEAAR